MTTTPNTPERRERLVLPGAAAKAPKTGTAASGPPGGSQKHHRAPFDPGKHVREFAFPDGRPISIHRHGVRFACPVKDDPENLTLVGLKEGEKPVPLRTPYPDFKAWWIEDRPQGKQGA